MEDNSPYQAQPGESKDLLTQYIGGKRITGIETEKRTSEHGMSYITNILLDDGFCLQIKISGDIKESVMGIGTYERRDPEDEGI